MSEALKQDDMQSVRLIRHLLKSLEQQYLIAKQDMLLAARSSPLHGTVINVYSIYCKSSIQDCVYVSFYIYSVCVCLTERL